MSSRIESINKIEVYEKNGKEIAKLRGDKTCVVLREHWNRKEFVIINIGEESVTVLACDLLNAIKNAQNAHSSF